MHFDRRLKSGRATTNLGDPTQPGMSFAEMSPPAAWSLKILVVVDLLHLEIISATRCPSIERPHLLSIVNITPVKATVADDL